MLSGLCQRLCTTRGRIHGHRAASNPAQRHTSPDQGQFSYLIFSFINYHSTKSARHQEK